MYMYLYWKQSAFIIKRFSAFIFERNWVRLWVSQGVSLVWVSREGVSESGVSWGVSESGCEWVTQWVWVGVRELWGLGVKEWVKVNVSDQVSDRAMPEGLSRRVSRVVSWCDWVHVS